MSKYWEKAHVEYIGDNYNILNFSKKTIASSYDLEIWLYDEDLENDIKEGRKKVFVVIEDAEEKSDDSRG